ncbi:MAG TPA: TCR/Tet family MFS transporter [Steroidobacteraceae bacterium]|jgi:DHA1 family tetracycline resistance protein-like MFS transporter|nr:TCR/Tet family MFS transporter [Steroidobacteraceae bacterium]
MSAPETNRHALAFIFITMLVDTIGLGIILPVTPKLITELTGQGMSEAARWGGWLFFVYALMQFFCAPAIGNLSDRFGRRPVLITSLAVLGVDYLITALAPTILWLFIARLLSGIAGAAYPTANAYIADVSPPEKRAANFGLVGAAFGIGFVIGPAIGGVLGQHGTRLPFYVSSAIAFCNAVYGFVVLKESLPLSSRRKFEWWRANPLGALVALRRFPAMLGLFGVVVLMRLAHDANPVIWTYYTMLKFNWSPAQVGYSLMVVGAMLAFVYSFLTRIIVARIGENRSVFLGLACGTIGFMGYAFATTGWVLYAWMAVWVLMALSGPSLNAIMSRQVGHDEQGELQGALASLGSLTSVAAPPILSNLFGYFTSAAAPIYFPGAAFFAGSVFLALSALVFAWIRKRPRTAAA